MTGSHTNETDKNRRATDKDKVLNIGLYIEKWFRLVWPMLVPLWTWFLINIRDNLKEVPNLVKAAKISAQNDSASITDRLELHRGQAITNKILCFNLNKADRIKYDINCDDIPLPEER